MDSKFIHWGILALLCSLVFQNHQATGQLPNKYQMVYQVGSSPVSFTTWHPSSNLIAVGGEFGLGIYDTNFNLIENVPQIKVHNSLEWLPNGELVVGGYLTQVFDPATWQPSLSISASGKTQANSNGTKLAIGGSKGIQVWGLPNGQVIYESYPLQDSLYSYFAWHPQLDKIAVIITDTDGFLKNVIIWDTLNSSYQELTSISSGDILVSLAWSPDGNRLALASLFGQTYIVDSLADEVQMELETPQPWDIDWKQNLVVSSGADILIWDTATWEILYYLSEHILHDIDILLSPDSSKLLSNGLDNTQYIWDLTNGTTIASLFQYDSHFTSIAWKPNTQQITTLGLNKLIKVWNTTTNTLEHVWVNQQFGHYAIDWSHNSQYIVTDNSNQGVTLLNAVTDEISTLNVGRTTMLQWNSQNELAIVIGFTIEIWDIIASEQLYVIQTGTNIGVFSWSPDNSHLAYVKLSDTVVHIWQRSTNSIVAELQTPHQGRITGLAWEPNGTHFATVGQDTYVHIWDVATWEIVDSIDVEFSTTAIAWNPQLDELAVGTARNIQVWDLTTMTPNTIAPVSVPKAIYWNSEGTAFVSLGQAGDATVWSSQSINETCINDSETLINSIGDANASGVPTTLCLSQDSTQTFDTPNNGLNALPIITGDITIEGNGATLTRDETADLFRFFETAPGGSR